MLETVNLTVHGSPGPSSYDLWLMAGNTGTFEDFLAVAGINLQPMLADAAASAAPGAANYRPTFAQAIADFGVGEMFTTDQAGFWASYVRTLGSPYFQFHSFIEQGSTRVADTAPEPFDGVLFDTARGDSFLTDWSYPVDAALTVTAKAIAFNSATATSLKVKLKDESGSDYRGCFEDWTIVADVSVTSWPAAGVAGLLAGWINDDPVNAKYGARLAAHGGTAAQSSAELMAVSSIIETVTGGGQATPHQARLTVSRSAAALQCTVSMAGVDRPIMTETLHFASDDHELPRKFSTPTLEFLQGVFTVTGVRVVVGECNRALAVAGTSLTQGRFVTAYADGYAQLLKTAYSNQVMVCGAPSATSADWLAALPELLQTKPRTILFEIFANDALTTTPLATTQANVAAIVALCKAANVNALFFNCPPLSSTFATAINSWLATTNYVVLDIYSLLVGTGNSLNAAYEGTTNDHIHWGTAGALAVKNAASPWLSALGVFNDPVTPMMLDPDPSLLANSPNRLVPQSAIRTHVNKANARSRALSQVVLPRSLSRKVMASPPTITYNASDPMGSSTYVPAADGAVVASTFNYRKGTKPVAGNGLVTDKGASPGLVAGATSNSSHTAGVGFVYDGSTICLRLQNNGQKVWIKVDGEYASMTPTTLSTDQATGYLQLAFGSAQMREIEVIVAGVGSQLRWAGVNIEPTRTVAPVEGRGPKIFVLGDSIAETTGPSLGINAYPVVLGDTIGSDNVTASALGGTGLLATATGTKLTYRQRVLTDVIAYEPDIVIISGSPNDSQQTTAAVSDELQLLVALIKANLPYCQIYATSMMLSAGPGFIGADRWRGAEGMKVGAAAAGIPFINLLEQDLPPDSVVSSTLSRSCTAGATRLYTTVKMAKNTTLKFTDGTHARVLLGTASGTGDYICDVDQCPTAFASGAAFTVVGNSIWSGNGKVGTPGTGNGVGNCDTVVSSDGVHPSDAGSIMIGTAVAYGLAKALIE